MLGPMRLALLLAAGALVAAATAAAATTPKETYRAAIIAMGGKKSVHYVATSKLGGDVETMVGDAALDRGVQRITYTHGGTTGNVTVVVVGTAAYVHGDRFALVQYMGLTAEQASRYAGKWFVVKAPTHAFAVIGEAVTFRSFVDELLMPGPYTAAPAATVAGKYAVGVRSTVTRSGEKATLTLYVAAGSPLPVEQVAKGSSGTITTTLARWNEKVAVAAPAGALAFH
jgi:hypothetical protein